MDLDQLAQLLNRDALDRYLRSLAPDMTVGVALDCHDCPIARWLKSQGAPDSLEVSEDVAALKRDVHGDIVEGVPMPEWATAFVMAVDAPRPTSSRDQRASHPVTAQEAVAIMNTLDIRIAEMRELPGEDWDDQTSDRQQ